MGVVLSVGGSGSAAPILGADMEAIEQAASRDAIGSWYTRAWDAASDWVYGTHLGEAKQCLYDLYADSATDQDKIASFLKLQELVGEDYKDRFQLRDEERRVTYSLEIEGVKTFSLIQLKPKADLASLQQELERIGAGASMDEQFLKDICRGEYSVSGTTLNESDPAAKAEAFKKLIGDYDCTDEQQKAIISVCNQTVFALAMISTCMSDDLGHPMGPPDCTSSQKIFYGVSREDGEIVVQARCIKDIAMDYDATLFSEKKMMIQDLPHMCKSLDWQLDLRIGPAGDIVVKAFDVYANKGLEVD